MSPLLHHPLPHLFIRHQAHFAPAKDLVAISGDEIVDGIAQPLRHDAQDTHPSQTWQQRQHGQRAIGSEVRDAAVDHRVAVGIFRIDAEMFRKTYAVAGLDCGEAKPARGVARGDEANPVRAEDADAVIEDDVVIGPRRDRAGHRLRAGRAVSGFSALSSVAP